MKKLSLVSLVSYLCILVGVGLCYLLPLPENIKALIAQPALLIIPFLVGKPFLFLGRKFLATDGKGDFVIEALLSWLLGSVFIVTLETFLYVNYIFTLDIFIIILLIIGLPSVFLEDKASFASLRRRDVIIAAVYGLFFAIFVSQFWPFPYANDNDHITHTFFVTRIVLQNRPLIFYGDYLPTMHTVYAVMMRLFAVDPYKDPLLLLWSSRYILYPVYVVGLYLLFYRFSRNRLLALLGAVIGSSLLSILNGCLFPYHTAPKVFNDLLIIYGYYAAFSLYREEPENRHTLLRLVGLGVAALVIYIPLSFVEVNGRIGYEIGYILPVLLMIIFALPFFVGAGERKFFFSVLIVLEGLIFMSKMQGLQAGFSILGMMFFLWFLEKISRNRARLVTAAVFLISASVIGLVILKVVPYPELPFLRPNDTQIGLFGVANLLKNFNSIYPLFLVFLAVSGCLFAIVSGDDGERVSLTAVTMVSLVILAYFTPIYMSFRFLGDAHPFIILLAASAIFRITRVPAGSVKILTALPLILVSGFLGVIIYSNDLYTLANGEQDIAQKSSFLVFEVGDYIKDHVDKGALIIQSQYYQQLSAFYGGVDVTYLWKGGQWYDSYVMDLYKSNSGEEAWKKAIALMEMQDQIVRYADKEGREIKRFYKPPTEVLLLCDDPLLAHIGEEKGAKFYDPRYFDWLYVIENERDTKFYIFRVKPEQGTTGLKNNVANPSFEDGTDKKTQLPVAWKYAWDSRWTGAVDETDKIDGAFSYRLETEVSNPQSWGALQSQDIAVEEGKVYFLDAKIKTENVVKTYIEAAYYDKERGRWVTLGTLRFVDGTRDWKGDSRRIEIPKGVKTVNIFLAGGWVADKTKGKSISWFDGIQFSGPAEMTAIQ